jgi:hypothetical protein
MNKLITFITCTALCLILTCCGNATFKGAATISGSGVVAYQTFDGVYEIIESNIDIFSPEDVVRLRVAGEALQGVRVNLCIIMADEGTAHSMVNDLFSLIPLYEKAKNAYVIASTIIIPKIDEFEGVDQAILLAFQGTCMKLDLAITIALDDMSIRGVERAQTVRDITGFIFLVGKIALPLIVL